MFTLLDSVIPLSGLHDVDDQMNKILGQTVKDIMTAEVLTVEEDTPLEEIATIMTEQHKHLLPVISQGKVVGVVDRWDVLRAIVKE